MPETKTHRYKATFILNTRNYEDPVDTLYEKLAGLIGELGGENVETRPLGRIEFSRQTEKNHAGDYFVEIFADAPPSLPNELSERTRLDKKVKRVMTERVD